MYYSKEKLFNVLNVGKSSSEMIEKNEFKHDEKIGKILKSCKTSPVRKKYLDVGELQLQENQRAKSEEISRVIV